MYCPRPHYTSWSKVIIYGGSAPFEKEEVESMIEAGDFFVVTTNRLVSGTVSITEIDERVWGERRDDNEALYVHKLATSDELRGQNVGGKIIDWVAEKARNEGRRSVRLDCSYTNQRLCNYYKQRGFKEVERKNIPRKNTARDRTDPIYKVALFQQDIKQTR